MYKLQLLLKLKDKKGQVGLVLSLYGQQAWVAEYNEGTVKVATRDARALDIAPVLDVPELDVVLELGLPESSGFDALVDRAAGLFPAFRDLVDPEKSVAIVGQEHVLVPGEGAFQLFRCFGRKKGIPLQQFKDHFLNIHSQFGIGLPDRPGYRQLHQDEAATTRLREITGFTNEEIDGVAQLFFHGPESWKALGTQPPERGQAASVDGGLFIDPDTRRASIATIVLNAGPIA
jgi:hypothetical protein